MNGRFINLFRLAVIVAVFASSLAKAEEHRATHLGNPATRFAPTMEAPDDLRARFRDPKLKPDIVEILRQWGWKGNLDDLFSAAVSSQISEVEIPVGATMPFMSSREAGKPICLRNVLWAGKQPISAYAFNFTSNGRRYRCVTPKPCSNFFLEDLGLEPKPVLTLSCSAPDKVPVNRGLDYCVILQNSGNAAESNIVLTFFLPPSAILTNITQGGLVGQDSIKWQIPILAPGASEQYCAGFTATKTGLLPFKSSALGARSEPIQSACETEVFGIPAILLEKADDPDPVSIGDTTTYTVKVTNQGSADDSNVHVVVTIAPELIPMSSSEGVISGQTVTLPVVPKLTPKQAVSYKIVAKGVKAGDGHTVFALSSDQLKSPISAEESTSVY